MKNEQDFKRLTRIVKLLNILSSGTLTVADAAEETGISVRSVQRDIKTIEEAGFPLTIVKRGQFSFMEGYSLRQSKLTDEEASILVLMADIVKPLGANFENSFNLLKKKIFNNDAQSPFYIKVPTGIKYTQSKITKTIEKAIVDKTMLRLTYGMRPENKLEYLFYPLKIINYDGFWYLLGIDYYKHRRKLKLDSILDAANTDEIFKVTKNLKKDLDNSKNIWFGEKRDKKIIVKVDVGIAHYFKQKEFFPLQKIVEEDKKGNLIIESKVSQNREAIQIIMPWIPYISVIETKDLKEEIKWLLKEGLKGI